MNYRDEQGERHQSRGRNNIVNKKLADQENELIIQDTVSIRQDRKRATLCYILVKMQSLEDKTMQKNKITDRSKYARIRVETKTRTPSARTGWMMTVSTEAEGLTRLPCYR